jgi:hypothetical protein
MNTTTQPTFRKITNLERNFWRLLAYSTVVFVLGVAYGNHIAGAQQDATKAAVQQAIKALRTPAAATPAPKS